MLRDISIEQGRITLTCTLPLDLETFASLIETPQTQGRSDQFSLEPIAGHARAPMKVTYDTKPIAPNGDYRIMLTSANVEEKFYYEDIDRLVKQLRRIGPATSDRLMSQEQAAAVRSKARKEFPGLYLSFHPNADDPRAEVMTANGRFEVHLLDDHHLYTPAKGLEVISAMNRACHDYGSDNPSRFSTRQDDNSVETITKAARVLVAHGIVDKDKEAGFVRETRAGLAKAFAHNELAAFKKYVDMGMPEYDYETTHYRPTMFMQSRVKTMAPMVDIMSALAKAGEFEGIATESLKKMQALGRRDDLSSDPAGIAAEEWALHAMSEVPRLRGFEIFCRDFLPEINAALQKHAAKGEVAESALPTVIQNTKVTIPPDCAPRLKVRADRGSLAIHFIQDHVAYLPKSAKNANDALHALYGSAQDKHKEKYFPFNNQHMDRGKLQEAARILSKHGFLNLGQQEGFVRVVRKAHLASYAAFKVEEIKNDHIARSNPAKPFIEVMEQLARTGDVATLSAADAAGMLAIAEGNTTELNQRVPSQNWQGMFKELCEGYKPELVAAVEVHRNAGVVESVDGGPLVKEAQRRALTGRGPATKG